MIIRRNSQTKNMTLSTWSNPVIEVMFFIVKYKEKVIVKDDTL